MIYTIYYNIIYYNLSDAFDFEMTLDTLRKAKALETVVIPKYDAVNATRWAGCLHALYYIILYCTCSVIVIHHVVLFFHNFADKKSPSQYTLLMSYCLRASWQSISRNSATCWIWSYLLTQTVIPDYQEEVIFSFNSSFAAKIYINLFLINFVLQYYEIPRSEEEILSKCWLPMQILSNLRLRSFVFQ